MKIKFLGAAETVTGSKYLLTVNEKAYLIDCGLFQGRKDLRIKNWEPFQIDPKNIEAVILTHAHLDHSGYIPILVRQGFRGPIYCTSATRDLCEILLRDSGRIQEEDARHAIKHAYSKHKTVKPLYTEEDAIYAMKQFQPINYYQDYPLNADLKFRASHAGHILGSSILTFITPSATIVFSGDLGRPNDLLMIPADKIQSADYLVLESTYGNRLHSKTNPKDELGRIIRETVQKGGTVVIPSFAVGRAQTILYLIYQLKNEKAIPDIPIYLDSPMAQDATDILLKYSSEHRVKQDLCAQICKVAKYVQTQEESKHLTENALPKVIISASGMAEGGRVLYHLEFYGPNPINAIVFAGYQAEMTRGDRILRGEGEVKIHGRMVPIRARVENLDNLSSHADYQETLEWLKNFTQKPREVFLTHGELGSSQSLKAKIENEFSWKVKIPKYGEEDQL